MIASENIVSPMVQKIVTSDLHGRYAEGLPNKRYYQGCGDFDTIESLGIDLAKKLFNVPFANIQSTSGTVSNIAALKSLHNLRLNEDGFAKATERLSSGKRLIAAGDDAAGAAAGRAEHLCRRLSGGARAQSRWACDHGRRHAHCRP